MPSKTVCEKCKTPIKLWDTLIDGLCASCSREKYRQEKNKCVICGSFLETVPPYGCKGCRLEAMEKEFLCNERRRQWECMKYLANSQSGGRVIGTCSRCKGAVCVPHNWLGTVPPTPTCNKCGATPKEPHGPEIPME